MPSLTLQNLKDAFDKEPEFVLDYFRKLGVVLDDNWEEYFEKFGADGFKIAGINNANHLMDAKELIDEAIAKGTNLKVFKDTLKFGLDLRGWHASLVVTQNISNSYSAGRYYKQQENTEDFPLVRPIVMDDSKTTDSCQWLKSQNICFRVDDANLKNMYSPRHFRCRTIYISITEKQRERYGLTIKDISDIPEKYWNIKEFRRLPSDAYKPDLKKYPKELQEKLK